MCNSTDAVPFWAVLSFSEAEVEWYKELCLINSSEGGECTGRLISVYYSGTDTGNRTDSFWKLYEIHWWSPFLVDTN